MDANAIIEKLSADAREAAAATLADAKNRAATLKAESDGRIAAGREKILTQAKVDGEAAQGRLRRMAELEERKRVLADKRAVMDKAFDTALNQMKNMPHDQMRAFLLRTLVDSAQGTETVIPGAAQAAWMDQAFVDEANAALIRRGRQGSLRLNEHGRAGADGFVLLEGEAEINCTFAALMEAQRLSLEAEVAELLFPGA